MDKNSVKNSIDSIGKLAKDAKQYGKDNVIVAFFLVFVLLTTFWTQQRMDTILEDNRIYNKELRSDMDNIKESNMKIVATNEKLITTNENLVRMLQNDIYNIKSVLNINDKK